MKKALVQKMFSLILSLMLVFSLWAVGAPAYPQPAETDEEALNIDEGLVGTYQYNVFISFNRGYGCSTTLHYHKVSINFIGQLGPPLHVGDEHLAQHTPTTPSAADGQYSAHEGVFPVVRGGVNSLVGLFH
mgnify:CR=1 FL=1